MYWRLEEIASPGVIRARRLLLCLATLAVWAISAGAWAVTPANTQLTATAKLTYTGNSTGITSSTTVTVQLVPSAVTIASTFSAPTASVNIAEGGSYSATYTIQSNANGPDTYTIATSYTNTNTVSGMATPTISIGSTSNLTSTSVTLGATAAQTAAAIGDTSITVPADGKADSSVNGVAANDTVIIGGNKYTVASVTDNASGTSIITLTSALTTAVSVGEGIYQYVSFTNQISNVGTQNGATNILNLQTTVISTTSSSAAYTSAITINVVAISMTKYVRDVTTGSTGTTPATYGGHTYYQSGVKASPGDTLEYLLVVQTSTAGISGAVLTDVLPNYTTYVANSTKQNGTAVSDASGGSTAFPLDSSNSGLSLGSIGTSTTVNVTYQVKVSK